MSENAGKIGLQESSDLPTQLLVFPNAHEAWRSAIRRVVSTGYEVDSVTDPKSIGSRFGANSRPTREALATGFAIEHPRNRLILSQARMIDLGFAIANTIWTFGGSNKVDEISFYNNKGWNFSEDGRTLSAAIGHRIFASSAGDQLKSVVAKLREDRSSRRAMISIFTPEDLIHNNRDCPCFGSMQFFVRNDKLVCLVYMRSQSSIMVLPYDLFLLTFYHELVASMLGLECGNYLHFCGSLHYYLDEEKFAEDILRETESNLIGVEHQMPEMPPMSYQSLEKISLAENDIRTKLGRDINAAVRLDHYHLDPYWLDILNALIYSTKLRHSACSVTGQALGAIAAPYRGFLDFAAQHRREKLINRNS